MSFVHDNELGTPVNEVLRSSGCLDEVGGDDSKRMSVEYGSTYAQIPFQALKYETTPLATSGIDNTTIQIWDSEVSATTIPNLAENPPEDEQSREERREERAA